MRNHFSTFFLEKNFDQLINSYIDTKVGTADTFLGKTLSAALVSNLNRLHATHQLHAAGTGNRLATQNQSVRSDMIYWLDRKHEDKYENEFFDLMDKFVIHLNSSCYTGITACEFHYAWYEKGSFYKKHIDQFRNDDSRKYSFIMYLNENWQEEDGGQLCIYHDKESQIIAPKNGRAVFFKSCELAHEVLLSNKPRLSITGWLKTGMTN